MWEAKIFFIFPKKDIVTLILAKSVFSPFCDARNYSKSFRRRMKTQTLKHDTHGQGHGQGHVPEHVSHGRVVIIAVDMNLMLRR
jgi:hypothetical protein